MRHCWGLPHKLAQCMSPQGWGNIVDAALPSLINESSFSSQWSPLYFTSVKEVMLLLAFVCLLAGLWLVALGKYALYWMPFLLLMRLFNVCFCLLSHEWDILHCVLTVNTAVTWCLSYWCICLNCQYTCIVWHDSASDSHQHVFPLRIIIVNCLHTRASVVE